MSNVLVLHRDAPILGLLTPVATRPADEFTVVVDGVTYKLVEAVDER